MKKLIFTLTKADSKTRIVGIVAIALAVFSIGLLIFSASKTINGSFADISIVKMVLSEEQREDMEDSFAKSIDKIEDAIDEGDEETIEEFEEKFGVSVDEVLDLFDPVSLSSAKKMADVFELENAEIITIIISVVRLYAIILAAFVFFSILGMNKGFFITSVALSALFFLVFAGMAFFLVFLALCIAYCILISKVKKAYIIYKHEQQEAAEEPVVVEEV